MATIPQWQGEVNRLSPQEAERKKDALQELLSWPFFREEFGSLRVIEFMLETREYGRL